VKLLYIIFGILAGLFLCFYLFSYDRRRISSLLKNFIIRLLLISTIILIERLLKFFLFYDSFFISIVIIVALIILAEPILSRFTFIGSILLKKAESVRFQADNKNTLAQLLVNKLIEIMPDKLENVACILKEKDYYEIKAFKNIQLKNISLKEDDTLIRLLKLSKEPLIKDNLLKSEKKHGYISDYTKELVEKLILLQADIAIPISTKDEFFGILTAKANKTWVVNEPEIIQALQILAKEASLCLQNLLIYEAKKLHFIRKFESFQTPEIR
jgi:hypothetical protein